MRRVSGIVAIVILLGTGCAKRSTTGSEGATAPPSATTAPAPFTNQELVSELRRQGVGVAATGQTGASGSGATSGSAENLPEITETPRGIVITLPSTFFAFDRSDLDAKARLVVERVAHVLNHPRAANRTVMLEGHTDNVGAEAYNLVLSRNRVETVARELIKQGMRQERVAVEAYGESRPIAPNRKPDGTDDPAGRAKNRRVEAVIRN